MEMFTISIKETFEASHYLDLPYYSACSNIHGHSYILWVSITASQLNEEGMILDFSELKKSLKAIVSTWDHALIVERRVSIPRTKVVTLGCNPTAENMAKLVAEFITDKVLVAVPSWAKIKVSVQETENNIAIYEKYKGEK